MSEYENVTTESILEQIEQLQQIMKTHRPTDPAWEVAGELLEPLFEEMAKREPQA